MNKDNAPDAVTGQQRSDTNGNELLRVSELQYRRLFEAAQDGILILDAVTGMITDVNPFLIELLGYSHNEFLGKKIWDLGFFKDIVANEAVFAELRQKEYVRYDHLPLETVDGRTIEVEFVSNVYQVNGHTVIQCNIRDITARKRAEAEKEHQALQSQKMEAIGRLVAGVAHDFNNQLTGIIGFTELCRERIGSTYPIREWLDEITHAAEHSAEIIRQLLAFARKQPIVPRAMDINNAVAGMLELLRRLIGEDINLIWRPGANLRPVMLDPSQFGQILTNMFVNARDAITGVGKIILETGNITIGADNPATCPEAIPGEYVFIAVNDNGKGMGPETIEHMFEPFFTTKALGVGTGLGLSTVYGIVKQNNGFICVYSEPSKGTTIKIYLPQVDGDIAEKTVAVTAEVPLGRGETVLLVEDEKSLRVVCRMFLESLGYRVLMAEAPQVALALADHHSGDIHLLLTDVIMPGMDGCQLAKQLCSTKPNTKVLFMSGYTADMIATRGVMDESVNFLPKPFTRNDLACKVRQVLDGKLRR